MPSPIRMPDLPESARREFVEFLFYYYRLAGRPTLREISSYIDTHDLSGTASKETIRRVLAGQRVPVQWLTAEAIFVGLCGLAGGDPDGRDWGGYIRPTSARHEYKQLWNAALDEGEPPAEVPPSDPWGAAPPPFGDEPPF